VGGGICTGGYLSEGGAGGDGDESDADHEADEWLHVLTSQDVISLTIHQSPAAGGSRMEIAK